MTALTSLINRYNIVKQIPIFSKLKWIELQKIARKSAIQEYKKGEIIRQQGDPPDFFYALVSGRVQAYSLNVHKKKDNVEFIHRGMHFGIISVLTNQTHSLNFEAINDSVVLKISKGDFHDILKSFPSLAIELSQSLSQRVRSHVAGTKSIFESTIIAIYSPLKGTGSSTYAINFAFKLQEQTHKKAILLNIHSGQNSSRSKEGDLKQAAPHWQNAIDLGDIVGDHDKIFNSIMKGQLNIDLLNVFFDAGDISLKRLISPLVSTLVGAYHYVIVDLPNDMDEFVLETLTQSDEVHLITFDRRKDLDLTRKVINSLESGLRESFRRERIKVIVRGMRDKSYLSYEEINKSIDFDVYTRLPHIQATELKQVVHTEGVTFYRCDENSEYAIAIRRIARETGGVMVGLALGGGAALGIAHVGVIKVLEEEGIPVDMVVGSSMGALIGSLWVTGRNAEELKKVALDFGSQKDIWKLFDPFIFPVVGVVIAFFGAILGAYFGSRVGAFLGLAFGAFFGAALGTVASALVLPTAGLIGDRAILRWLRGYLGKKTFYGVTIPFKVVTYDLTRREEIVITSGDLVDAVRKSIAIPGVLEPVQENGKILIDGGVLNPLPTNILARHGIKKIIAVNVLQSPEHINEGQDMKEHELNKGREITFQKSPLKFVQFRLSLMLAKLLTPNIPDVIVQTLQATEYVIAEQSGQQADVLIHPDLTGINWFELWRVNDLIKSGEEATRRVLPQIKKLISVDAHLM